MIHHYTARLASREVGLLSVILAGALGVRLLGVSGGLPYLHEWDETVVLRGVIGMFQRGDLNPGGFIYPSVYYYMLLPVVYLHYLYLHAHGVLSSPQEIQLSQPLEPFWYLEPASFYLWARVLTSLVGAATVFLVYRIGKTVYSPAVGLLAAAFLAVAPGAVYYADTVRVDVPMAFFVTLTILAGLGIIRRGRWQDYLLAGLLAGLAISTKQNILVVVAILAAHVASPHRTRLADLRLAGMGLCVLAGFVIGTPYAVIVPQSLIQRGVAPQVQGYGGLPSLTSMQPHAAMGVLPAASALIGVVAGFRWDRRLHLYLLSFPLPFFLFMSVQTLLRNMMAVLPFAALFAAVGCIWAWRLLQARWLLAQGPWARALAGLALVALLAAPGRDAVALGWTLGHRPDTRTAAVEWLRHRVPPGARIALEEELQWYIPDPEWLPFTALFVPRDTKLAWYLQQHVDFAVVGDHSPLRSLPAVATFPRPTYLERSGSEHSLRDNGPVIDPTVYIIRPKMPEIDAGFPVTLYGSDMIPEAIVPQATGMLSETVHLPEQRFAPGSYVLTVTGEWPRAGASLYYATLTAEIVVGQMTVGQLSLTNSQPLAFTTPAFRIDQAQTLPVRIELTTFWIEQQQTPGQRNRAGWALHPSTTGCAVVPDTGKNARKLDIQQMTLGAWVYLEGMNEPPAMRARGLESEAPILSKGKHLGYYLRLVGDTGNRIFGDLSVAGKFSVGRAGFVPLRVWTHIAATYDGHEARIYQNGVPAPPERNPHYEGTVHAEGAPLAIGCRDPGTPDQTVFKGLITGARIWNRVLPPAAIWDEAHLRLLPDTSAGLVGSWSFQSLVRGMVPDLSGAGNNLTVDSLQRVPLESPPPSSGSAQPAPRTSGQNPLRTVRIDRVTP